MRVISIVAEDLVNKISAIADLGEKVAMTLGGTESDPALTQVPPPYAWIMLTGSTTDSQDRERWTRLRHNFTVALALPYGDGEEDFTYRQLSLIEEIGKAVTGTSVDALDQEELWSFDGMTLTGFEPKKAFFSMNFSITTFYTQSM